MYEGSAQEFVDEGIAPNLEHAIEIVKELRKHRLPPISRRQNNDRYVAQLKDEEFRGLFRMDRELFFSDIQQKVEVDGLQEAPYKAFATSVNCVFERFVEYVRMSFLHLRQFTLNLKLSYHKHPRPTTISNFRKAIFFN